VNERVCVGETQRLSRLEKEDRGRIRLQLTSRGEGGRERDRQTDRERPNW
jgi:hypothetical protein